MPGFAARIVEAFESRSGTLIVPRQIVAKTELRHSFEAHRYAL